MWMMLDDCSKTGALSGKRFNGPLDLRAPEDQFSSSEQVEKRYRRPMPAPELESAIAAFMHAWFEGDEDAARLAAKDLIDGTRAHFQAQGVPTFAHPIVPPQFAQVVAEVVRRLPANFQEDALHSVIDAFDGVARAGVQREISRMIATPAQEAEETAAYRKSDLGAGCGCSSCAGKSSAMGNTIVD